MQDILDNLTRVCGETADACDASGDWPEAALDAIGECGGWKWAVPEAYGGVGLSPPEQLEVYMALARGSVSVALIVTQRDGAIDLIATGDSEALKVDMLPRFASGEIYTTVGIAQLTTSQRHTGDPMRVVFDSDEVVFDGLMPWSTGADHAGVIVTGGVVADGRQVLALVPTDAPGLVIDPPVKLVGLQASRTSQVQCENVRVPKQNVIIGPIDRSLARRSPVKHWVTSSVGIGLAQAMLDQFDRRRMKTPPKLKAACDRIARRVRRTRAMLLDHARSSDDPDKADVDDIRIHVNDMLIRLAGIMMTVVKGSGYTASHSAQRLAREALFFCVWSAPDPIREGTAESLLGSIDLP